MGRNDRVSFHRRARTASRAMVFLTLLSFSAVPTADGAEPPTLVFLGDRDYPPVAYLDDEGTARGMDVDLAKAVAARMKRPVRIDLTDWNQAQARVLQGEADGLLGL